jgi:glycosyltransferase involved in cell wall biosynthesis
MKVVHVQKVSGIGGSERHLLTLLPRLQAAGIAVHMVVLSAPGHEPFLAGMERAGIDITTIPAGPDLNPPAVVRLAGLCRRLQPSLVHTHLVHADLHGQVAAAIGRIPGVSTMHGTPAFYDRLPYRSVGRLAGRLAVRRIAISGHVARFMVDRGLAPPEKVRTIPYGLDVTTWDVTGSGRQAARAELGIPDEAVVVAIGARLIPGKGHEILIDAVAKAQASFPGLHLLVAGDGPLRASLEARAGAALRAGSVAFLGFVADMRPVLAASDLLAFPTLPTLGEGFGLAALEAMAAARPVIASAVGSLPEVVVDGTTGIIVPPGDVGRLAGALGELAAEPARRQQLGRQGRRRASAVFGLDAMVASTIELYREVVTP